MLDKTIGISSSSLIFAAVEVAVDDAEPDQEIASQKIHFEKLIKILRSGGTWSGPSVMKS